MIEDVKRTAKKTLLYSFGNIFTKLIGFILLPFYTTNLTVAQYGLLAVLETTLLIIFPLLSLNIQSAVVRFLPEQKDEKKISQTLWSALFFVLIAGIVFNAFLQPFSGFFSKVLFQSEEFSLLINLLFVNIALQGIFNLIKSTYNSQESALLYTIVNLLNSFSVLVLTIYFLSIRHMGLRGVLFAQTLSYSIVISVFLPLYMRNAKKLMLSVTELKNMLKYSYPLAFSSISSMVLTFGDRYVLNFMNNRESVGLYSMATKFVNVIDVAFLQAFQLSYLPYAFKNYSTDSFKYFHKKTTTYMVIAMFFLGLIISLFAKEVLVIFSPKNKEYWQAAIYIPLVVFLKPLTVLRFMFSIGLMFKKKTKSFPLIVFSASVLNVGLNVLLIPSMKVYGVILASVISFILMDVAYYFIAMKHYTVKYEIGKILFLFLYSAIFLSFSFIIKIDNFILSIFVKLVVLALYPVILYFSGFIDKVEKEFLIGFVKKYSAKIFSGKKS